MESSCPFMAISSAMDKSKSGSQGEHSKIPVSCPVSGKRMSLEDKKSGSIRTISDRDDDEDEVESDYHGNKTLAFERLIDFLNESIGNLFPR